MSIFIIVYFFFDKKKMILKEREYLKNIFCKIFLLSYNIKDLMYYLRYIILIDFELKNIHFQIVLSR